MTELYVGGKRLTWCHHCAMTADTCPCSTSTYPYVPSLPVLRDTATYTSTYQLSGVRTNPCSEPLFDVDSLKMDTTEQASKKVLPLSDPHGSRKNLIRDVVLTINQWNQGLSPRSSVPSTLHSAASEADKSTATSSLPTADESPLSTLRPENLVRTMKRGRRKKQDKKPPYPRTPGWALTTAGHKWQWMKRWHSIAFERTLIGIEEGNRVMDYYWSGEIPNDVYRFFAR